MPSVTIAVPDEVVRALGGAGEKVNREIRLAIAFHFCSRGSISASLAAQLAGLSYADFLQEAASRKIELFPLDLPELQEEVGRGFPASG